MKGSDALPDTNAVWGTSVPTIDDKTEAGDYYVWYRVTGGACEPSVPYGPIKVTIDEAATGATVSGTVTSFLDDTATVTIELFVGDEMKYSTTTTGNTANYTLENVESGTYTMKVSKANHVTREYTVTVAGGVVTITEGGETVTGNLKIHPVGDVTGDGVLDTFDVMMSNAHARRTLTLSGYQFACADITNDGVVDTFDVMMANAHARRTLALW